MSPAQFWLAVLVALFVVYLCWRSERIDTFVGVLFAVLFLFAAVYLTVGSPT
jgi:Co/Zn/Cd efflux system component